MTGNDLLAIRKRLDAEEKKRLSPYACFSSDAIRRHEDANIDQGHRQNYALDADRVLHSLAYTRYIDKTQVFSLLEDDHITHRVLHVQLVSKIARSMGRLLGLNEDLIEAVAMGHDIGHPPFGHDGESYLSEKCLEHKLGPFLHNVQSVRFLERLENRGRGLNLSLQVLDGVLCHDGEVHTVRLQAKPDKNFESLEKEQAAKLADKNYNLVPMTLEGCVVRIADTVAYIGRDLEDAIRLGLVSREDVPREAARVLGSSNGTIVYRLVDDILRNSAGKPWVGFTPEIAEALRELKKFNYDNIYLNPKIKTQHHKIRRMVHDLFEHYLEELQTENRSSGIFREFVDLMEQDYLDSCSPPEMVRDYLAGMTDEHLLRSYGDLLWPERLSGDKLRGERRH